MLKDLGILILRLSIGGIMIFHGVAKLVHGVGFLQQMFAGMGLPEFFAYGVFLGEIVAPVFLIIGFKVRLAALVEALTMVVAISMAHSGDIFSLSQHGGWAIELPALFLFGSLAIALIGGGKFSIDK